jgi:hypothetical protein
MGKRVEAVALGLTHYTTGVPCIHGHIDVRRVKDRVCAACDRAMKAARVKAHPEVYRLKAKAVYQRGRVGALSQKRLYRQTNKGKINALVAARKQHIRQRTPKWIGVEERWLIKQAYELASLRTEMFGFAWHVDHVIPLQGKNVSGLHVPQNLQVIPGVDNIRKKNGYLVL